MSTNVSASTQQVSEWLSNFGSNLDRADFDAAMQMFAEDSYWRDLVSLTWNIKTLEGKENIKAMLKATVTEAKPGQWRIEGDANSDSGLIDSWFTFETAVSRDIADLIFASVPYKILPAFQIPVYKQIAERDAEFYERLTKAGFLLDFGEDGSGLFMKYLRRGSGYYIDVGASELIAEGKIRLKSGVSIGRIKERSVVLTDGTELPADLIVYATGYGSMNDWAARLISQDVADKVGKCWGLGSGTTNDPGPWEGELRNMWKPTHQPSLWFHVGNLHQSRHYSQFLSLQIKARMEGISTPVYGMGDVHHLM
jgi:cation diffusion facilitator CzcD-associated flavoprotein CzcO